MKPPAIVMRARLAGIEVPRWVPSRLAADYCDTALAHGEEFAASRVRKMKRDLEETNKAFAMLDTFVDALKSCKNVKEIDARLKAYIAADIDLRSIKPSEFVEADRLATESEMGRRIARS